MEKFRDVAKGTDTFRRSMETASIEDSAKVWPLLELLNPNIGPAPVLKAVPDEPCTALVAAETPTRTIQRGPSTESLGGMRCITPTPPEAQPLVALTSAAPSPVALTSAAPSLVPSIVSDTSVLVAQQVATVDEDVLGHHPCYV